LSKITTPLKVDEDKSDKVMHINTNEDNREPSQASSSKITTPLNVDDDKCDKVININ